MEVAWMLLAGILGGAVGAAAAWLMDTRHQMAIHKLDLQVKKVERDFDEAGERIGVKAYDHARKRIDQAHPVKVPAGVAEADGGDGGVGRAPDARPTPAEIMRLWRHR